MTDPSIAEPPSPYVPPVFAAPAPTPVTRPAVAARTKLLLEAPIFPTLLRLAAPNILNLVAFVAVIIFDGYFLGRIGTDALAGASLAFPWIMLVLQTTNSGMGAGVSSAVARALGAAKRELADKLTFHAFSFGARACCHLLGGYAVGRSQSFQLDGWARYDVDRRALLRRCRLRRCFLHNGAQPAW
jgi:hypothetical protein